MLASLFRMVAGLVLAAAMLEVLPPPQGALAATLAGTLPQATHLSSEDFVRAASPLQLSGPASEWWEEAAVPGRQSRPAAGSVMLLTGYCDGQCGHAAIVTRIVSSREVRIDHADWLHDGAVYRNDPVADVSPGNDWSQVRVFNLRTGAWGGKIYKVRGFLSPEALAQDDRNPPPGSPFALTDEDRAIPSAWDEE